VFAAPAVVPSSPLDAHAPGESTLPSRAMVVDWEGKVMLKSVRKQIIHSNCHPSFPHHFQSANVTADSPLARAASKHIKPVSAF